MTTKYNSQTARAYQETTDENIYESEAAFKAARKMLGNLEARTVLDFGCGTGRSSRLLRQWGAQKVIGVDQNSNMITVAQTLPREGIEYYLLPRKDIPKADKALSACVLMEIGTKKELQKVHRLIAETLTVGGEYVAIVNNALAIPYESEQISIRPSLSFLGNSGDIILAAIKGEKPFEFRDHYWTVEDYKDIFESTGFKLREVRIPKPQRKQQTSPYLVLKAVKY